VAKVTSKLQVTIPRALAAQYGIEPGDDIEWSASGDAIRLSRTRRRELDVKARLRLFDQATLRQRAREKLMKLPRAAADRGWTREELYDRGRSR
jgi:bifunctional DNA-binding transcriptional regulator/antitoxin component of YhaV-PrlF toxin-antitoxin module